MFAPASAYAWATARPMPSAAPVMMATRSFRRNWSRTLLGTLGVGRGSRWEWGALTSSTVIDMLGVLGNTFEVDAMLAN